MKFLPIITAFAATTVMATSTKGRSGCVATSYDQIAGTKGCSAITIQGPFTVPANNIIDLSGLKAGTTIKITGTITFAKGNLDENNYLVTIGGTNIKVDGTRGTFNGNGPLYWDGKGGNGGVNKPKFVRLSKMSGSITGLTIIGSPVHTFAVNGCQGLALTNITIDNRGPKYALAHNTDGFDVSSCSDVTITGAKVYNNDDCLAVNSGTNIAFNGNYCEGGHGISIGSIKAGAVVDGVVIKGNTVVNSANAVRIKAYANATGGRVNNVTYTDTTLSGITDYGIVIQQDYTNAGATGKPGGAAPITNINLYNIHGTMAKKSRQSVYILCAKCSNFNFQKIAIAGGAAPQCSGISPKPMGC
ncbi:hypothetical protein EMPS_09798 [Entomortierella parvispora]|uniref:endo-polygalacturonase n=1 Tax=Entomortierella parvispora TaxID=205924 RepID=A0A9P3M0L8_9FUNG|nr:hypothetical protein EMPS_09798 [Entomortierella parvispora]